MILLLGVTAFLPYPTTQQVSKTCYAGGHRYWSPEGNTEETELATNTTADSEH